MGSAKRAEALEELTDLLEAIKGNMFTPIILSSPEEVVKYQLSRPENTRLLIKFMQFAINNG